MKPREHEGTERDTESVGQDMSMPLKFFLVSGSLFSETSARLQPRSKVFSEKGSFNGGFVVRTHKHFSWGHNRSLYFVGI